MLIEVVGEDGIGPQARTYAEYRLFAALSPAVGTGQIHHARAVLRRAKHQRGCEGVSCTVTVALHGGDAMRIRAIGDHAYAAIDRAVERLRAPAIPAQPGGMAVDDASQ